MAKKEIASKNVIKAMSLGLAAVMATMSPMATVATYADDIEPKESDVQLPTVEEIIPAVEEVKDEADDVVIEVDLGIVKPQLPLEKYVEVKAGAAEEKLDAADKILDAAEKLIDEKDLLEQNAKDAEGNDVDSQLSEADDPESEADNQANYNMDRAESLMNTYKGNNGEEASEEDSEEEISAEKKLDSVIAKAEDLLNNDALEGSSEAIELKEELVAAKKAADEELEAINTEVVNAKAALEKAENDLKIANGISDAAALTAQGMVDAAKRDLTQAEARAEKINDRLKAIDNILDGIGGALDVTEDVLENVLLPQASENLNASIDALVGEGGALDTLESTSAEFAGAVKDFGDSVIALGGAVETFAKDAENAYKSQKALNVLYGEYAEAKNNLEAATYNYEALVNEWNALENGLTLTVDGSDEKTKQQIEDKIKELEGVLVEAQKLLDKAEEKLNSERIEAIDKVLADENATETDKAKAIINYYISNIENGEEAVWVENDGDGYFVIVDKDGNAGADKYSYVLNEETNKLSIKKVWVENNTYFEMEGEEYLVSAGDDGKFITVGNDSYKIIEEGDSVKAEKVIDYNKLTITVGKKTLTYNDKNGYYETGFQIDGMYRLKVNSTDGSYKLEKYYSYLIGGVWITDSSNVEIEEFTNRVISGSLDTRDDIKNSNDDRIGNYISDLAVKQEKYDGALKDRNDAKNAYDSASKKVEGLESKLDAYLTKLGDYKEKDLLVTKDYGFEINVKEEAEKYLEENKSNPLVNNFINQALVGLIPDGTLGEIKTVEYGDLADLPKNLLDALNIQKILNMKPEDRKPIEDAINEMVTAKDDAAKMAAATKLIFALAGDDTQAYVALGLVLGTSAAENPENMVDNIKKELNKDNNVILDSILDAVLKPAADIAEALAKETGFGTEFQKEYANAWFDSWMAKATLVNSGLNLVGATGNVVVNGIALIGPSIAEAEAITDATLKSIEVAINAIAYGGLYATNEVVGLTNSIVEKLDEYVENLQKEANEAEIAAENALKLVEKLQVERPNSSELAAARTALDKAQERYNNLFNQLEDAKEKAKKAEELAEKAEEKEKELKEKEEEEARKKAEEEAKRPQTPSGNEGGNQNPGNGGDEGNAGGDDYTPADETPVYVPNAVVMSDEDMSIFAQAVADAAVLGANRSRQNKTLVAAVDEEILDGEAETEKIVAGSKEEVVEDVTKKEDAIEVVTINDEPTALAGSLTEEEKAKISWWWLLIIAALGATGYEMYKKHKEKKEANIQK